MESRPLEKSVSKELIKMKRMLLEPLYSPDY